MIVDRYFIVLERDDVVTGLEGVTQADIIGAARILARESIMNADVAAAGGRQQPDP